MKKKDIIFTGSYKPLSETEIREFERWLESELPPKYRNFLLARNGGHPHKHELPECYVQGFYAVTKSSENMSLQAEIEKMMDDLPDGVIPIGDTGIGDRICLSISDDKLYLWEHERAYETLPADISELVPLAENIDELLNALEGDNFSPVPDDEISNLGRWGDVGLLDAYLGRGNDINQVSAAGNILVLDAVYAGNLEFVKECVKRGAALENRGLLHAAAFSEDFEMMKYLLEQGLDPNEVDNTGQTPLDCILPPGTGALADLLISKGGAW